MTLTDTRLITSLTGVDRSYLVLNVDKNQENGKLIFRKKQGASPVIVKGAEVERGGDL